MKVTMEGEIAEENTVMIWVRWILGQTREVDR